MDGILIPVKRLHEAKARLARILQAPARRQLGLAMFSDVLRATAYWKTRIVVTSDPDAKEVSNRFGCTLVEDPGAGLNGAILRGTEHAAEAGIDSLLVLASDVPLVTHDEVTALFETSEDVVVARSTDGGTNALLRRPCDAIGPSFGRHSAAAHEAAARHSGRSFRMHTSQRLAFDVDNPSDLGVLASRSEDLESVRVARDSFRQEAGGDPERPSVP
jgi:2-phospho-L-lactate guanylyltransferase